MKIGLVGEAPNDTLAIRNLLRKRYTEDKFTYVNLLNNINGSQLDSQKTKRFLRIEFETQKPELIIFIRDLDSLLNDRTQLFKRKDYFTEFNRVVDKKGVFLLHIYEIEALILTDIETFNKRYNCDARFEERNVMHVSEPKEILKQFSNKYSESHNGEIFDVINFNKTLECEYFSRFIKKLEKIIP